MYNGNLIQSHIGGTLPQCMTKCGLVIVTLVIISVCKFIIGSIQVPSSTHVVIMLDFWGYIKQLCNPSICLLHTLSSITAFRVMVTIKH